MRERYLAKRSVLEIEFDHHSTSSGQNLDVVSWDLPTTFFSEAARLFAAEGRLCEEEVGHTPLMGRTCDVNIQGDIR